MKIIGMMIDDQTHKIVISYNLNSSLKSKDTSLSFCFSDLDIPFKSMYNLTIDFFCMFYLNPFEKFDFCFEDFFTKLTLIRTKFWKLFLFFNKLRSILICVLFQHYLYYFHGI